MVGLNPDVSHDEWEDGLHDDDGVGNDRGDDGDARDHVHHVCDVNEYLMVYCELDVVSPGRPSKKHRHEDSNERGGLDAG